MIKTHCLFGLSKNNQQQRFSCFGKPKTNTSRESLIHPAADRRVKQKHSGGCFLYLFIQRKKKPPLLLPPMTSQNYPIKYVVEVVVVVVVVVVVLWGKSNRDCVWTSVVESVSFQLKNDEYESSCYKKEKHKHTRESFAIVSPSWYL